MTVLETRRRAALWSLTLFGAAACAVAIAAVAFDAGAAASRAKSAASAPSSAPARLAPNPLTQPLGGATAEELKAAYRHCDGLAQTEDFDDAAAAACSVVYEELKARVFRGDTERVIAWMQQQREANDAGRTAGR